MGGQVTLLRLKSAFKTWSRQLTWPWLLAFGLLGISVAFYLLVVVPARHAVADLKVQLHTMMHDEKRLQEASQEATRQAPAGQLAQFYEVFPYEPSVPDTIEQLIALAKKAGLDPRQAEYRVMRNNPGELLSYQIMMPIKGAYPKVLEYSYGMLSGVPNLSLDNINFRRQKIGDNVVEATLWMTLYIKRGRPIEH